MAYIYLQEIQQWIYSVPKVTSDDTTASTSDHPSAKFWASRTGLHLGRGNGWQRRSPNRRAPLQVISNDALHFFWDPITETEKDNGR